VSVASVRDTLVAEYEVDPGTCERDLLELLAEMARRGLVEVVEEVNLQQMERPRPHLPLVEVVEVVVEEIHTDKPEERDKMAVRVEVLTWGILVAVEEPVDPVFRVMEMMEETVVLVTLGLMVLHMEVGVVVPDN
jgi:hypothetical protein